MVGPSKGPPRRKPGSMDRFVGVGIGFNPRSDPMPLVRTGKRCRRLQPNQHRDSTLQDELRRLRCCISSLHVLGASSGSKAARASVLESPASPFAAGSDGATVLVFFHPSDKILLKGDPGCFVLDSSLFHLGCFLLSVSKVESCCEARQDG